MKKIGDERDCSLCGACTQACKNDAIHLVRRSNGFFYPQINQDKCISCGQCERKCQYLNDKVQTGDKLSAYVAYSLDKNQVKMSASGGVSSVIARYIMNNNGSYFGAAWNADLTVSLQRCENHDDINRFVGSKYVQSRVDDTYIQIEKLLKNGSQVFIVALPCQIAGLKSFLQYEYENLITADIICHGCGSEENFKRYIDKIENDNNDKLLSINHTDKSKGWNIMIPKTIRYSFENAGSKFIDSHDDCYLELFLSNLFYKKTCYTCRYNRLPRVADLTFGDCFGIGSIHNFKSRNSSGLSMVMTNTERGERILREVKDDIFLERRDPREFMYFNHNIWKPSNPNPKYEEYAQDYDAKSTDELVEKYYSKSRVRNIRKLIKKLFGLKNTCRIMFLKYYLDGTYKKVNQIYDFYRQN